MDIIKYVIKYINYPLAMILTGNSGRLKSYRDCMYKQYRNYDVNIRERNKKLYKIVTYAVRNVPYYREIARKKRLTFTEATIEEDIKKLPILTKEIIREQGSRLYSKEKIEYYYETSGGSTGEPVKLRHDDYLRQIHPGDYFLSYAGYDIGDKKLLLWGSERDILSGTIGLKAKIANRFVHRSRMLNSFLMDEAAMRDYVNIINKWKPKTILAYVQSIYELAIFIKKEGLKVYSPSGIVVSAGTLYPDWKKLVEQVFRCPVINQYGSRETPGIAVSCKESDRLHINSFINYVEIVDEQNQNLPNGQDGNIVVTNLVNKSMPLIRYKIGDVGALSSKKKCRCGRKLPSLQYVKGRTVNIFKRRDGAKIDGEYFTHLFYGIDGIKKFQVIQEEYEKIDVRIELDGERLDTGIIQQIESGIKVVMGENCVVNFAYVDSLMPTKSGKFIYTISLI